uniref:Uncharacterized protein n=1 Tax=Glossina austeni TaxID=7395 RepID=A0A1A9V7P0_GLOAU
MEPSYDHEHPHHHHHQHQQQQQLLTNYNFTIATVVAVAVAVAVVAMVVVVFWFRDGSNSGGSLNVSAGHAFSLQTNWRDVTNCSPFDRWIGEEKQILRHLHDALKPQN